MDLLAFVVVMFFIAASNLLIGDAHNTLIVTDFGAVGDGKTDDSQSFQKAWAALCRDNGSDGTLVIPNSGTFLLKPVKFEGPCKPSSVQIQVLGKLMAPNSTNEWGDCPASWIYFNGIDGLIVNGSGSIDGQGACWWKNAQAAQNDCKSPRISTFHDCNNLKINGISFLNSPRGHIVLNQCNGVSIANINITSPGDSPNTDGIDLSGSTQVIISNSSIATGDDCVAVNGGCSNVNITGISCGPGHGISIGSLGDGEAEDNVEEVHVTYCNFTGTQNGARIKTVPGGSGYARNIFFEQITLVDTKNSIIIDQHYCDGSKCAEQPKAVAVSDISYIGFNGTTTSAQAITLDCAKIGCSNITMDDINIVLSAAGKTKAVCHFANGTSSDVVPDVPCLAGKFKQFARKLLQ